MRCEESYEDGYRKGCEATTENIKDELTFIIESQTDEIPDTIILEKIIAYVEDLK